VINDIKHRVWVEYGLADPERPPSLKFGGFASLPFHRLIQSYWAFREHGVLLTDYLDQPEAWWDDIEMLDAIESVARYEARKKSKAKS
jgi:hypothetical protein